MNDVTKLEEEVHGIKTKTKWGCLAWIALLVFGPIIVLAVVFSFEMYLKEKTLLISHSPNNARTIEVVEKGQPFIFGPSSVRIKSDRKHIDRNISNDGKTLKESNVAIHWNNDNEAMITLYGEEQSPEVIRFSAMNTTPFEESIEIDQGYFTFKKSESPNLVNIIELREVSKSKGAIQNSTVQIFYGERGSNLEKYKEHIPSDTYTSDNFMVSWLDDEQVKIEVVRKDNDGEIYIEDVIEIDIMK